MKVLVDTSVWSLALRRPRRKLNESEQRIVDELESIIRNGNAIIIGVIRQEILTGIREIGTFELLRNKISAFPNEPVIDEDYEEAARLSNACRSAGITGSAIDLLICAIAIRLNLPVFTTDKDFYLYQKVLPVKLV